MVGTPMAGAKRKDAVISYALLFLLPKYDFILCTKGLQCCIYTKALRYVG